MPTPPLPPHLMQEALNLVAEHGGMMQAARATGIPYEAIRRRAERGRINGMRSEYVPEIKESRTKGVRVLVIPDMHAPFMHPDTAGFLAAIKARFQPDKVICLGDETDQHVLSQHEPDPSGYSAGHEHLKALDALQPIYELFPVVSVCTSNHGERLFKRAYRAGIPKAFVKDYAEFMNCPPGWNWQHKFEVDGVVYEHGEGVSGQLGAMKRAMSNLKSTVIGHLHADAGVLFFSNGERTIFAMNAGCLIDAPSYAFAYGKNSARKPMIGCGIVDRGVPAFIPMELNRDRRWTGRV